MFNKTENKKPTERKADRKLTERNLIGKNTKIIGDVISEGDFRIDGGLEGTLKTNGRVIIGGEGFVKGKVECANADVEGKFSGEFIVSDTLSAKSTANITGEITMGRISTEPGASLNATCNMKGAVKELSKKKDGQQKQTQEKTA